MTPTLGVLTPAGGRPYAAGDDGLLDRWLSEGLVGAVWVRDLPATPAGDPDVGQGDDPFAYLARLAGAGRRPATVGTASVILGTRHPLVVARAAVGAQVDAGGRFVLGLGTGGKPATAVALGVTDRPVAALADEWERIHHTLHGVVDAGLRFVLPPRFRPPPMWLASDDLAKWRAVGHYADGWQTFLTTPGELIRRYAAVSTSTVAPPVVAVRIDLRLLPDPDEMATSTPVRGVVTAGHRALRRLLAPWRDLPVDHVLVNLHEPDPSAALAALREAWSLEVRRGALAADAVTYGPAVPPPGVRATYGRVCPSA